MTSAREVELGTGTAVWHYPGLPLVPLRWVLVRDPLGRFALQALLATDPALSAEDVVGYSVRRWQVGATFQETRRHLGVETQGQWSDTAIARTTPVPLALFSVATPLAARLVCHGRLPVRTAAWYATPTSDTQQRVGRRPGPVVALATVSNVAARREAVVAEVLPEKVQRLPERRPGVRLVEVGPENGERDVAQRKGSP